MVRVKEKYIGCPSYRRGRREKAKTHGGSARRFCRDAVSGDNRPHLYTAPWYQASVAEFFPCCGNGTGTSRNNRGSNGNYWSSTWNSARNARNLNFNSGGVNPQNNNNRYLGMVVRAVQHLSIA